MRDTIGGYPYEVSKESGKTVIKFFPKSKSAKDPNLVRFMLTLDQSDLKKLSKIGS